MGHPTTYIIVVRQETAAPVWEFESLTHFPIVIEHPIHNRVSTVRMQEYVNEPNLPLSTTPYQLVANLKPCIGNI